MKYTHLSRVKQRKNLFIIGAVALLAIVITVVVLIAVLVSRRKHSSPQPNVALFNLPAAVTPPSGQKLKLVYLGYGINYDHPCLIIGTQNYTCNATSGSYPPVDTAEAVLLDLTPYYTETIAPSTIPPIQDLQVVGRHFYVPNPVGPGASLPSFKDRGGFVVGKRNNSVPSSRPEFSVPSVLLANVQPGKGGGSLANWVVRTDVDGGVVPAQQQKCAAGDAVAIPYRATYLFFS